MWSIFIAATDDSGLLSSELWELGTTGIEEASAGLRAYFEDTTNPDAVRTAFSHLPIEINASTPPVFVQEDSQREPIFVGSRFVIVPAAQAESQRLLTPGRIVLPIDAAMAFGSGRHETTQLCLTALHQLVKSGHVVFDIGCGSGVLALAAQMLGAAHVIGMDIDEPAIAVARRHFSGPLFVGSADCLAPESADIVICNITGPLIDRLAYHLNYILKPDGRLILSGFTVETAPRRFQPNNVLEQGDWQAWICHRSLITDNLPVLNVAPHPTQWWLPNSS